jgi:hypothetical protein
VQAAGALDFIFTANQCPSDTKSAVGLRLLCGANFLILVSADHLGAGGEGCVTVFPSFSPKHQRQKLQEQMLTAQLTWLVNKL